MTHRSETSPLSQWVFLYRPASCITDAGWYSSAVSGHQGLSMI